MPKRKRATKANDRYPIEQIRCHIVAQKIQQCKKQLHRVIKTAKSFERQKLGKRLARAESVDVKQRINLEIEALKDLDSLKFAETHLYKSILKVKAFVSSGLLPEDVRNINKTVVVEEAQRSALNNVTSGILNMKVVKETMEQVFKEMYLAIGIPIPARKPKGQKMQLGSKEISALPHDSHEPVCSVSPSLIDKNQGTLRSPEWESFESENSKIDNQTDRSDQGSFHEGSIDEKELDRFDSLIANDSDEESFDEKQYNMSQRRPKTALRSSSSNSSISNDSQIIQVMDFSTQPVDLHKSKPKSKLQPTKAGLSTFLPTLMGGYWSGSESASDLEDFAPAPKKNRPGQVARRAIAEKKYGLNANHIKLGKGSVTKKDDGWDKKRGAIDTSAPKNRRYGRFQESQNSAIINPGEMIPYGNGKFSTSSEIGKLHQAKGRSSRDDIGVLHPSWQAAKKAKEAKQTAKFEGKKVVFD